MRPLMRLENDFDFSCETEELYGTTAHSCPEYLPFQKQIFIASSTEILDHISYIQILHFRYYGTTKFLDLIIHLTINISNFY